VQKTFFALVFLFVAGSTAIGQVRGPAEITVQAGKLQALPLVFEGDEIEYAILGGDYFGGFREFSPPNQFKFQLLGYEKGTGYVVVSSTKGGKLQPLFTVKVSVVDRPVPPGPGPGPDPGPDPNPPAPPDPDTEDISRLAAAIKSAGKKDGFTQFADLSVGLNACALLVADAKTSSDLFKLQSAALLKAIPGGVKDGVFNALAPTLRTAYPNTVDHVLTDAEKAKAKKTFTMLAKACEKAGK
jgi:hypothetical protein